MPVKIFSKEVKDKHDGFVKTMFEGLEIEGSTETDFKIDETPVVPPPPPLISDDGRIQDGFYSLMEPDFIFDGEAKSRHYAIRVNGDTMTFLQGEFKSMLDKNYHFSYSGTFDESLKQYKFFGFDPVNQEAFKVSDNTRFKIFKIVN